MSFNYLRASKCWRFFVHSLIILSCFGLTYAFAFPSLIISFKYPGNLKNSATNSTNTPRIIFFAKYKVMETSRQITKNVNIFFPSSLQPYLPSRFSGRYLYLALSSMLLRMAPMAPAMNRFST